MQDTVEELDWEMQREEEVRQQIVYLRKETHQRDTQRLATEEPEEEELA